MYRRAELRDVDFIAGLLTEFWAKRADVYRIPLDQPSMRHMVNAFVTRGICVVGPTSYAAANLVPFPYNRSVIIAQVASWYFKTPREIEILDLLISVCKAAGATQMNVAGHFPQNSIVRHYAKRGLKLTELHCLGPI